MGFGVSVFAASWRVACARVRAGWGNGPRRAEVGSQAGSAICLFCSPARRRICLGVVCKHTDDDRMPIVMAALSLSAALWGVTLVHAHLMPARAGPVLLPAGRRPGDVTPLSEDFLDLSTEFHFPSLSEGSADAFRCTGVELTPLDFAQDPFLGQRGRDGGAGGRAWGLKARGEGGVAPWAKRAGLHASLSIPILPPSSVRVLNASAVGGLGEGAHGQVTAGLLDSPFLLPPTGTKGRPAPIPVAIKHVPSTPALACRLLEEGARMRALSVREGVPGIIPVYGAIRAEALGLPAAKDSYALVMARMACTAARFVSDKGCPGYLGGPPGLRERLVVLADAAESLASLHDEAGAAHGDVKGANVLVGTDGRGWMTDFGRYTPREAAALNETATALHPASSAVTGRGLPLPPILNTDADGEPLSRLVAGDGAVYTDGWGAPETLYTLSLNSPSIATAKSDVFAFGVTMWEMFVRQRPRGGPFAHLPTERILDAAIMAGARPPSARENLLEGLPDDLVDLMRRCWDGERDRRPSMRRVARALREALTRLG
jgi:hypothetical protein